MEPILKWAGGKRQLLPYIEEIIVPNIQQSNTFYEPFVGGGSVFLSIMHSKTVINDYNHELINVYEQIRDNPIEIIECLEYHQQQNNHDYYYFVRSFDRNLDKYSSLSLAEKAARTIYLNKTCYNGLYRVNTNGFFNVPMGRQTGKHIFKKEKILELSHYLRTNKINIMCGDFSQSVNSANCGDFIYFDPPYDYEESGFTSYTVEMFSREDLLRLKLLCDDLIDKGCKVLVSNNDTEYVNDLFSNTRYLIKHIKANRMINRNPQKRKDADEVLIYGH